MTSVVVVCLFVCLTALLFQRVLISCIHINSIVCYIRYIWLTRTVVFNQKSIIDLLLYHKEFLFMNANCLTFF